MIKQLFAPTIVLVTGLALGSCTSFSNTVSDTWPTWLGGMPKDVPPRPGAPGYDQFLVHQQGKDATTSAAPGSNASAPVAPSGVQAPNDQATVQGGLY